jgi:hypothetical protein
MRAALAFRLRQSNTRNDICWAIYARCRVVGQRPPIAVIIASPSVEPLTPSSPNSDWVELAVAVMAPPKRKAMQGKRMEGPHERT